MPNQGRRELTRVKWMGTNVSDLRLTTGTFRFDPRSETRPFDGAGRSRRSQKAQQGIRALRIAGSTGPRRRKHRDFLQLGRQLAHQRDARHALQFAQLLELQVEYQGVQLERLPLALQAVQQARADITLTNASPARREVMDFSRPVLAIELGFLVGPQSAETQAAKVDRPGVKIAVSAGSTSQSTLPRLMKHAEVVALPSLPAAGEALIRGEVQAIATNKAQLYQLSESLPGSRLLPGDWGVEQLAFALPKGRKQALALLNEWLDRPATQAALQQASERAGLRGTRPIKP